MCSDSILFSKFKGVHNSHPKMMGTIYLLCVFAFSLALAIHSKVSAEANGTRRNIVLIVADDLGWNDVSLHGTDQVLTPNIDVLGYAGVTLGRYYSHCACTPSRSALLTGKYAYTLVLEYNETVMQVRANLNWQRKIGIGMQGYPLTNGEDRGLPLTEKILPEYLKELGYATHLVGKWHVGGSREKYLPRKRGFDTHFGHRGGYIDYYEYTLEEIWDTVRVSGMDLYRNETAAWDVEGYATDLYNEEAMRIIKSHDTHQPLFLMLAHLAPHGGNEGAVLQAPPEVVRSIRHVESPERRIYAAMMKKLDDSVGDVLEVLEEKGILNDTIIVFISDNGAMTSGESLNYGNNYPLRGLKMSPLEGGVRVTGTIWTPDKISSNLYQGYVHVSDWVPTLLRAIGSESPSNIDGHDLWEKIMTNQNSSRTEIVEIDDMVGFASITSGDYKLITGNVPVNLGNYQGGDFRGIIGKPPCYIDTIKKSKAYNVFEKIGKSININDVTIRKVLQNQCEGLNEVDDVICFPGDGKVCLYDIKNDPCERKDLSDRYPDIVDKLLGRLEEEKARLLPRLPVFRDPRALPSLFNYTWEVFAD